MMYTWNDHSYNTCDTTCTTVYGVVVVGIGAIVAVAIVILAVVVMYACV